MIPLYYRIVRSLQMLLFIVAYPVGKLLDLLLGKDHVTRFKRSELKELVNIHGEDREGPLTVDETTIIKGALDMKYKTGTYQSDFYFFDYNSIDVSDSFVLSLLLLLLYLYHNS